MKSNNNFPLLIDHKIQQVSDEALVAIAAMSPMVWIFHGTGAPTLANFPSARVGDVIRRMSDGQEWRVDA